MEIEVGWVLAVQGPPLPTSSTRQPNTEVPSGQLSVGAALVALPILTVDVWGADEVYHQVFGTTPQELISSTTANAPGQCHDHGGTAAACAGPVNWQFDPTYTTDPTTGICVLTGVTETVTYAAYVPQWAGPSQVSSELVEWWGLVLEHLRWHEEQHIRTFVDYVAQLDGRIAGATCDAGQAIINQWAAELEAAQEAFDVQDRSWQFPPYP